jgi:hypothetical protein
MQGQNKILQILKRAAAGAVSASLLFFASAALAQLDTLAVARTKVSTDLGIALTANSVSGVTWAKETSSGRMVKVLVMAHATVDPDLVGLRNAIVSAGGTVYYRYISVSGVAAVIPAGRVMDIARRTDVESVSIPPSTGAASASRSSTRGSCRSTAPSSAIRATRASGRAWTWAASTRSRCSA